MKLLTLNTHSLQGEGGERFVQGVLTLRPDLIALQEVNQLRSADSMKDFCRNGYVSTSSGIPPRSGNYAAFRLAGHLGPPGTVPAG